MHRFSHTRKKLFLDSVIYSKLPEAHSLPAVSIFMMIQSELPGALDGAGTRREVCRCDPDFSAHLQPGLAPLDPRGCLEAAAGL